MRLSVTQAMRLTQLLRKVPSSYSSSYFDKNTNKAMNQYNKVSECKNHSKDVAQINKNMDHILYFLSFYRDPELDSQDLWVEKDLAILKPILDLCLCTFVFGGSLFFWFGFVPGVYSRTLKWIGPKEKWNLDKLHRMPTDTNNID